MRKTAVFALAMASAVMAAPAQSQTVDEVLERHYEAIGGLDAWQGIRSMKSVGSLSMPALGIEAPFSIQAKRPNQVRVEFTVQGMKGIQAYDGTTAWQVMPFMGITSPQPMPAEQVATMVDQADFDGPLVGWKAAGHSLELVGTEDVNGSPAYKLALTTDHGVQHLFLDTKSYLTVRVEADTPVGATSTSLGDYKPVNGLMMPHKVEVSSGAGQQIVQFSTIEANLPLDDSVFRMPTS